MLCRGQFGIKVKGYIKEYMKKHSRKKYAQAKKTGAEVRSTLKAIDKEGRNLIISNSLDIRTYKIGWHISYHYKIQIFK